MSYVPPEQRKAPSNAKYPSGNASMSEYVPPDQGPYNYSTKGPVNGVEYGGETPAVVTHDLQTGTANVPSGGFQAPPTTVAEVISYDFNYVATHPQTVVQSAQIASNNTVAVLGSIPGAVADTALSAATGVQGVLSSIGATLGKYKWFIIIGGGLLLLLVITLLFKSF